MDMIRRATLAGLLALPAGGLLAAPPPLPLPDAYQRIGLDTATRLNTRFFAVVDECAQGLPAYRCSGVMLRAARRWEPTEGQARRDGVAFSYLRADLNIEEVWAYRTQGGFIADMSGHSGYPLRVRCVFPYDGATDTRPDGCGEVLGGGTPPGASRSCAEQGIDTVPAWLAHFDTLLGKEDSCAFAPETAAFAVSLAVKPHMPAPYATLYNEILIAAWPTGAGGLLPIEAFYFVSGGTETPRNSARSLQSRFRDETGRWVPIVRVDLRAGVAAPFTYRDDDQSNAPL